eukprot:CAMPEP_0202912736 /NCGR_PEP_ID=MMETSP1392-20130828/58538_1 /ASSEMBLY_ACC=CAM_ASM_000868 /TAXON_ID=225041 /ORGANISM="Chlamydomonas chlamydogama, Strain SAG 11-48b" /LENGTH=565 /DNA_ID=CAMNT_0049603749 /DNA_START=8 /DNA_END=1702 /DNA_ORIENTATION=-
MAGLGAAHIANQGADLAGGKWVSEVLAKLWPYASRAVEVAVREMAPDILNDNKPTWMEGIVLERFVLGDEPPTITGIHVDETNDDETDEVRLEMCLEWRSKCDIQLTVKPLPKAVSKYLPSLVVGAMQYMTSLTAGVQSLSLQANVLLTLTPLKPRLPVVSCLQVCFTQRPALDFSITLTKGEMGVLNYLKPWLLRTIATAALDPLVIPEHVAVPIEEGGVDEQSPEGIVLVTVEKAENVPKMDYFGHSDTYVDLWVRPRIKRRTAVINNEANPVWSGESFQMLVHTRRYQSVTFELWDEDNDILDAQDDYIGTCVIPIRNMTPGKEYKTALQVHSSPLDAMALPGQRVAAEGASPDVSSTKLHVVMRYVPAKMADMFSAEIGAPGVLRARINMVEVPHLGVLPLKIRMQVQGQSMAVGGPPTSPPVRPLTGKDKERTAIPFSYDAVFDVLGPAEVVNASVLDIEVLSGSNVVASFHIPVTQVRAREVEGCTSVAGGEFILKDDASTRQHAAAAAPTVPPGAAAPAAAGAAAAVAAAAGVEGHSGVVLRAEVWWHPLYGAAVLPA